MEGIYKCSVCGLFKVNVRSFNNPLCKDCEEKEDKK